MSAVGEARPRPLSVRPEGIPAELRDLRRFVVWSYERRDGRWTKPPLIATEPTRRAASTDPQTWRTFAEALAAIEDGKVDGLGFVLGKHGDAGLADRVIGIDIDGCIDGEGLIDARAQSIIDAANSYTEISPSGRGIRILALADALPGGRRKLNGVEIYDTGRYLTLTGHHIDGTPATLQERTQEIAAIHAEVFGAPPAPDEPEESAEPTANLTDDELIARAGQAKNGVKFRRLFSGDHSEYGSQSEADAALSAILAFWSRDGVQIDRLFRRSGLMRAKWDEKRGAKTYGGKTIRRAIAHVTKTYEPPSSDAPVLNPSDPMPSARAVLRQLYTREGFQTLWHQAGVFFTYDDKTGAYRECDEPTVRAELYKFLETAKRSTDGSLKPFQPTRSKVEDVLDALRGVTNLPTASAPPCWLGDPRPRLNPLDILAGPTGLLHIPTRTLHQASPEFFTVNGVTFGYNAAQPPAPREWLAFLKTLWPDDEESINTLQEIFGYALTPDTRFQKIFLLVGPPRSGKGVTARVLRCLIGERNTCSPTLAAFGRDFGKHVLINKTLAIVSDARISGRTDTAAVAETLLSISGQDAQTVERKFLPDWNGTLSTRFLLLTNELPHIGDASGALAKRFIVLALRESFYGKEDLRLFERLTTELPAILNWALEGRDRLYARGHFIQPASANDLIEEFANLSSPESAFVKERCQSDSGATVAHRQLFEAWKLWCEDNGRDRPGTAQTFGRNLRARLPWLKTRRLGGRGESERTWQGLRLMDPPPEM